MAVPPFVGLALFVCEKMQIFDKDSQKLVMRFCKIYSPQKIADITNKAQSYVWWQKNPKAAFMKAVGEINRQEKEMQPETPSVNQPSEQSKKKLKKLLTGLQNTEIIKNLIEESKL